MGTIDSKFCQLLMTDNLEEALEFWQAHEELHSKLNMGQGLKGARNRDPPLHCLLRHGNCRSPELKELLQTFLDRGANPLILNNMDETALHIVCCSQRQGARENKARSEILDILIQRLPSCDSSQKTAKGGNTRKLTEWLEMQDVSRNTALHLAAASGLLDCVELLLAYGAPLFVTNIAKKTAMESAVDAKQMIIAQFLESQMVMTDEKGTSDDMETLPVRQKHQSFYSPDQLKTMQEELRTKVSQELQVLPDAARALLSAYSWSRDLVLEAWKKDKIETCAKAGLDPAQVHSEVEMFVSLSQKCCDICFDPIPLEQRTDVPCGHNFCRDCWASYLEVSVKEGGGKDISCPGHDCSQPVPMAIIAKLISDELYRKYSDLNVQHFVDISKDFKWCPHPGCNQAVVKREARMSLPVLGKRHGVNMDCGNGHGFCWNCNKHAHEPCECEIWEKWLNEVSRMSAAMGIDMSQVAAQAEADAQWIINNTKPCPNCSSPIQKTEGCNHITCGKCYHDFCWVCLDPWRDHSYRTGGYFSCNRYVAQRRASGRVQESRSNLAKQYRQNATVEAERQKEKFTHYHERYANHLHGIQIECQILVMSQAKTRSLMSMRKVVEKKVASKRTTNEKASLKAGGLTPLPVNDSKVNPEDAENFLEGVIRVLLQSRHLLATSYGIGYLIPDEKKEVRDAHDTLQGKLEEVVESLSQMVNRSYLNTPRTEMASRARDVDYICHEFIEIMREVVLTGLTEEPPPQRPAPPTVEDEAELDIDPLIIFAHLAMRNDPQFRELFNRLISQNDED